jgi:hypothetical protein
MKIILKQTNRFFQSVTNTIIIDLNECYKTFRKLPTQMQSALSMFAFMQLLPITKATGNDKYFFQDPSSTTTYELFQKDPENHNYAFSLGSSVTSCNGIDNISYNSNATFQLIAHVYQQSKELPIDFLRMENSTVFKEFETCILNFLGNNASENNGMFWTAAIIVALMMMFCCKVILCDTPNIRAGERAPLLDREDPNEWFHARLG